MEPHVKTFEKRTIRPPFDGQFSDNFRTIFGQFHLRLTNFPCFRHNFGTIGPSFDSRVVPIEISTSNSTKLVQFGPRLTGVSGPVQPILQGGGAGQFGPHLTNTGAGVRPLSKQRFLQACCRASDGSLLTMLLEGVIATFSALHMPRHH